MTEQQIDSEILTERRGRICILTLNRPKALNALSLNMVTLLDTALAEWADDPAIDAVLIRGNGRGFCAGGDVRAIGQLAIRKRAQNSDAASSAKNMLSICISTRIPNRSSR